jgi:23S rRNA (guanosine2251-2'-O)-methyltransferase
VRDVGVGWGDQREFGRVAYEGTRPRPTWGRDAAQGGTTQNVATEVDVERGATDEVPGEAVVTVPGFAMGGEAGDLVALLLEEAGEDDQGDSASWDAALSGADDEIGEGVPDQHRLQQHPVLVEDDAEIIAGRRPVEEALAARRAARRLLVVPQRRDALEALVRQVVRARIPVVEIEGGTLTSLAGFDGHQGIALVVPPRAWASLDDVLARAAANREPAFVLVLDSLEDPQNLGTMLRSAEACGVHGVIFPTRRAAPLTPAAIKASAGAVEHLLLVPVDDLPGTLVDLKTRGLRVVGAEADAALSYRDADFRGPLALVIGSEGHGLGSPVRRRLEFSVRIPMRGRVGSLNASVAGSILLFEAAAQRPAGTPAEGTAEASVAQDSVPSGGSAADGPVPPGAGVKPPKRKRREAGAGAVASEPEPASPGDLPAGAAPPLSSAPADADAPPPPGDGDGLLPE